MRSTRYSLSYGLPLYLGLAAFGLYLATGARTIQWQDSAQFTYRIATGTWQNDYGLAMVHPLHFGLGRVAFWCFPEHLPWALSGVSALGGGLTVGLVAAIVFRQTRSVATGCFAALTLMLAHTFWRFSGLPEVYTLSAALLMAEIGWFLRLPAQPSGRQWTILFAINGLALSNHNLALLSLPVWSGCWIHSVWINRSSWKSLAGIAGGWLLGAGLYLGLILREGLHSGEWGTVIHSALFGHSFQSQVTGLLPDPRILAITLGFLMLSFPGAGLPLALRGGCHAASGWMPVRILIALHLLFFLRYNVIDQYTFLIPAMAGLALFAGMGFHFLRSAFLRQICWILLALQPVLYALTPLLVTSSGVLASYERSKPYRDDARYLFLPWMAAETSAHQLAADTAAAYDSGAGVVWVEDPMALHTLKWWFRSNGLPEENVVLRKDQPHPASAVWVPARSDIPLPAGWRKQGEVWIPLPEKLDNNPTGE